MTKHCWIKALGAAGMMLALGTSGAALAQQSIDERNPNIEAIEAGDTVHASRVPDYIYLRDINDPGDIIWDRIPTYSTFLTMAPPVHPSTKLRFDPEQGENVYFQLARTEDRFYVRLRWQDTTQNAETTVSGFRDGAAIQFALGGTETSYMMGSGPDKPVNIWYWRADREEVEDLAAGGYGSTTHLPEQPVSGRIIYNDGETPADQQWELVMSRKIGDNGEHQVDFSRDQIPIAFALWQGADGQRDGNKRVSHSWILLDPRPADDDQSRAQASNQ